MNKISSEEIVRFPSGREVTGNELDKHAAGATLTKLARQHAARKNISFQDALHEIVPIVPGEMKHYLGYQLPDTSRPMPRGGGSSTEILFRASEGWSENGVSDWLQEQGFRGGTLTTTDAGYSYIPQRFVSAFPR